MLAELVRKNRTYRRFYQDVPITRETLEELVDLARLAASGGNRQPLKYLLVCEPEKNALLFPQLVWAAYLKDWPGPEEGERPTGYVIILGDTEISKDFGIDPGLSCQNLLLGAVEKGLGGCILASINRKKIREIFNIPERYEILYVVALGKPKEEVVIEEVGPDGDIKYWRDENQVHHVPKRALKDIIIG
ncbi:MAG: nitroreductase family protein [Clostridia bacterium]|nr:nitroreductase family protein [Clostridia bacterium]